jgi:hypothetical protein
VWEEREREVRLSELAVVERPSQSLVGVVYASCQQAAAGCDGRAAALRLCEVERTVHCYKGGMRLCGCRPRRARAAKREGQARVGLIVYAYAMESYSAPTVSAATVRMQQHYVCNCSCMYVVCISVSSVPAVLAALATAPPHCSLSRTMPTAEPVPDWG